MDIETRMELIQRAPTEEVVTEGELRQLLETKAHPIAYGGWEPSGLVHLGTGLICAYKMKDFIEAGVRYKVWLACWHAWINDKLDGDMGKIKRAARHFVHSWVALGVPEDKIELVWPEEEYADLSYWNRVVRVAKALTIPRVTRTLEIMGRKETEARKVADLLYTPMQVADIFHLEVDICQLGMDQRKAHMVAREVGPRLGLWKPVCVHHHLLQGLAKPPTWPLPEDPQMRKEVVSSVKMSKSMPQTCIFIYDSPQDIRRKVLNAYCEEKIVDFNPVLDMVKHIIFRENKTFTVERPARFGGNAEFQSYQELEKRYRDGKLHPLDLKKAVAEEIIRILEPVRIYFNENKEAKTLLEFIKSQKVTR